MDSGGAVTLDALVFHQIRCVRVYGAAPHLVLWRAREAPPADFCTMLELFEILPEKVFLPRPPETILDFGLRLAIAIRLGLKIRMRIPFEVL